MFAKAPPDAVEEGLCLLRERATVNIISAPYIKTAQVCSDIARRYPQCFNPDTDFPTIGVLPELGSAGWVNGWTSVAEIVGQKKGTAFFVRHRIHGLVGSQQDGELKIARLLGCNIEFVDTDFAVFSEATSKVGDNGNAYEVGYVWKVKDKNLHPGAEGREYYIQTAKDKDFFGVRFFHIVNESKQRLDRNLYCERANGGFGWWRNYDDANATCPEGLAKISQQKGANGQMYEVTLMVPSDASLRADRQVNPRAAKREFWIQNHPGDQFYKVRFFHMIDAQGERCDRNLYILRKDGVVVWSRNYDDASARPAGVPRAEPGDHCSD